MQRHTLRCHCFISFDIYTVDPEDMELPERIEQVVSNSWCLFINPKKLFPGQLKRIVDAHEDATKHGHATILLFTDPFTKEQKENEGVDTKELHRVDLRAGFDTVLRDVLQIVRKATGPCWDRRYKMMSNMFNDGWYLLDMESSGTDPLESEVISISVAYMAGYEIQSTETLYIKQKQPISQEIVELTGITNEMLEQGIDKEDAVKYLNDLPAPIIIECERYFLPFLKSLYHSCGQKFDLPFVALEGFMDIAFGHLLRRQPKDVLPLIKKRKYMRTPIEHPYLAELYDMTLMVFENLQDRYGVRAPGDFHSLYSAIIKCCE